MKNTALFLFCTLSVVCLAYAKGSTLFDSNETLALTLQYDIVRLQKEKLSLRETGLPGTLTFKDEVLPIKVMPRGKGSFSCDQPQLKLNFGNVPTKNPEFTNLKNVKLYTMGICTGNAPDSLHDSRILSNYLIYKLAEEILPVHFQTRLAKIQHVDTTGVHKPYSQLALFLEPKSALKARTGLKMLEPEELLRTANLANLADPESTVLTHAFQFFIGNMNYGIPGMFSHINGGVVPSEKNISLLRGQSPTLLPISFDFDFSRFIRLGGPCDVSRSFIFTRRTQTGCTSEEIEKVLREDMTEFRFAETLKPSLPRLLAGFTKWRAKNQEALESLGPEYNKGLDQFVQAFENTLR